MELTRLVFLCIAIRWAAASPVYDGQYQDTAQQASEKGVRKNRLQLHHNHLRARHVRPTTSPPEHEKKETQHRRISDAAVPAEVVLTDNNGSVHFRKRSAQFIGDQTWPMPDLQANGYPYLAPPDTNPTPDAAPAPDTTPAPDTIPQPATSITSQPTESASPPVIPYIKVDGQIPSTVGDEGRRGKGLKSSVRLTSVRDWRYSCPVQIGETTYHLLPDTGSADIWVRSTLLEPRERERHRVFDVEKAQEMANATYDVSYGDLSNNSGKVYFASLALGGAGVPSQAIEAASHLSDPEGATKDFDGYLGLSTAWLNSVSPVHQPTYFDNIYSDLEQPVLGFDFRSEKTGQLDVGHIDRSKFVGELLIVPTLDSRPWFVAFDGYMVGDTQYPAVLEACIDTGGTGILLPVDVVRAYYSKVRGARISSMKLNQVEVWEYPCTETPPNFGLVYKGQRRVISGSLLTLFTTTEGYCSAAVAVEAGGGNNIGVAFFRSQYVTFQKDGQGYSVGFGQKPPPPTGLWGFWERIKGIIPHIF